jgi:hypothetical protein
LDSRSRSQKAQRALVLPVGEEDPDHVVSGFPVMVQRKGLAMVWLK